MILLVFLNFFAAAATEEFEDDRFTVAIEVDRSDVKIAEPVTITVTARAPKSWRIQLPQVPRNFGPFKVTEQTSRRESDAMSNVATVLIRVEAYAPGTHRLELDPVTFVPTSAEGDVSTDVTVVPSRAAQGATADGASEVVVTRLASPISVRVRSAISMFGSPRLRSINGKVFVPWTWKQWLLVVLLVGGGGWLVRQIQRHLHLQREPDLGTPEGLLLALDRLDEERLSSRRDHREVVLQAAELVKKALMLADNAGIHRTTSEWLRRLAFTSRAQVARTTVYRDSTSDAVVTVLKAADEIKYAGVDAAMEDSRRCVEEARGVIVELNRGTLNLHGEQTRPADTGRAEFLAQATNDA